MKGARSSRSTASVGPAVRGETVIVDRIWNSSQSWYRQRIVVSDALGGARLRFHIRRNAYTEQSSAVVEVWSVKEGEWRDVHRIAGVEMQTVASYADRNVTSSAFDDDIAELRRVALAVIGGSS